MPRIRRTKGGNRAAKHIAYINISVVLGGMQGGNRTAKHIAYINISVVLGGMQGGNRTAKPCKGAIYKPRVLTLGADETREHYI